jgi:hypothetical protein
MRSIRPVVLGGALALSLVAAGAPPAGAQADDDSAQVILDWNEHALASIATSPAATHLFMAMVHGAMYDAVVSIAGGYQPYLEAVDADPGASKVAAAAQAAHDVLLATFPDAEGHLAWYLKESLAAVPDGPAKDDGIAVGQAAAAAMIAAREGDGRDAAYELEFGDGPGEYRPTKPDFGEFPHAWLAEVRPFLADSPEYYRTAGPRALGSPEYAAEYEEVRTTGGPTGTRTPEQEAILNGGDVGFGGWAQIERDLVAEHGIAITDAARLFAIANLAAGDAAIGCWNDKYHWMFWRPVTAIEEAADDGNDATQPDQAWVDAHEGSPPYPDHPSGFNCFAGAHVGGLQAFFGTDEMTFTAPGATKSYTAFSQGLQDAIDLRILQGLHFRSADEQAAALGQKAAALAAERLAPIE